MAKSRASRDRSTEVPALRVRQWLSEWDQVEFGGEHQRRPDEHFFVFSMAASTLKALCGIQRREAKSGRRRAEDLGIQRRHDPDRSKEIREFVRHGFPWSELSDRQKRSGDFDDLKKPGWLPTSIVVNILTADDHRADRTVAHGDLISVRDNENGTATLGIPKMDGPASWRPKELEPMEVIDGQHRLWAFSPGEHEDDFQLPVVGFVGLDLSWQAYLFWTINIKPKRINASLAFDLYPLLRTQNWLERFEGPSVYRQTRAQELTELLWAHPDSPWYHRINMLGETGVGGVSQAAWVRSLTATYVKAFEGRGVRIGGLFGAPVGEDHLALPWTRSQQAAFLILAWQRLVDAIDRCDDEWAEALREAEESEDEPGDDGASDERGDPAFFGGFTLLNSDQGVRAFLYVTNDLCYWIADDVGLSDWSAGAVEDAPDVKTVTTALSTLSKQSVAEVLDQIADSLAHFDWRTSAAPGLSEEQRTLKSAFRGSGGYREMRRQLLAYLAKSATQPLRPVAREVRSALGLE